MSSDMVKMSSRMGSGEWIKYDKLYVHPDNSSW